MNIQMILFSNPLLIAFIGYLAYLAYKNHKNKTSGLPIEPTPIWVKTVLIIGAFIIISLGLFFFLWGLGTP